MKKEIKKIALIMLVIVMLLPIMLSCNGSVPIPVNSLTDSITDDTDRVIEDEKTAFYNSQLNYSDGIYTKTYYKNEWLDFSFIPNDSNMYLNERGYNAVKNYKSSYDDYYNGSKKFLMSFFDSDSSYTVQITAEKLTYENRNIELKEYANDEISELKQSMKDTVTSYREQGKSVKIETFVKNEGSCKILTYSTYFIEYWVSSSITNSITYYLNIYFIKDGYIIDIMISTDNSIYTFSDLFLCCKNYSGDDNISNYIREKKQQQ